MSKGVGDGRKWVNIVIGIGIRRREEKGGELNEQDRKGKVGEGRGEK